MLVDKSLFQIAQAEKFSLELNRVPRKVQNTYYKTTLRGANPDGVAIDNAWPAFEVFGMGYCVGREQC